MLRVNPITNTGCKKPEYRQAFTSSPQIQTQNEVPSALPDYNVKVPMAYQKAGVLNLPFDFLTRRGCPSIKPVIGSPDR